MKKNLIKNYTVSFTWILISSTAMASSSSPDERRGLKTKLELDGPNLRKSFKLQYDEKTTQDLPRSLKDQYEADHRKHIASLQKLLNCGPSGTLMASSSSFTPDERQPLMGQDIDYHHMSLKDLAKLANQNDRKAQRQILENIRNNLYEYKDIEETSIFPSTWHGFEEEAFEDPSFHMICVICGTTVSHKVLEVIQRAAEQGDAQAQLNLGLMHQRGLSVIKDNSKAFEWCEKSAKQGHKQAQFEFGFMYQLGLGIKTDYAKAFEWYEKSAKQGHKQAQYELGFMYQLGLGIKTDYAKAIELFIKARIKWSISALRRVLPISPQDSYPSSERSALEEDIYKFKITHSKASQTWAELTDANNPKSPFKKTMTSVPYLQKKYQILRDLYISFDIMTEQFLTSGFMLTCFNPTEETFLALRKSNKNDVPFVKAYSYKGIRFLTFGRENVERADQLMRFLRNSFSNSLVSDIQVIENFHTSMEEKLSVELECLQISSKDLDVKSQTEQNSILERISTLNTQLQNQEEILGHLRNLSRIPVALSDLMMRGVKIRNHTFLEKNSDLFPRS